MKTEPPLIRPAQIDFPGFEIDADDTVVDIGCGDGVVCVYAGHRGADVIGLDIEPELIERAEKAMAGVPARSFRGIVGDADPIPLPDAVASVVVCTEVLEHVDDPSRILNELVRIGKPGARYLISVPDPASESLMRDLAPSWYFEKPIHIRVFEHEVLDRCCQDAGLEIDARHSTGFYFSMYWMIRMSVGMEHKYADAQPHPAFTHLDGIFDTLLAAPGGHAAHRKLDRLIPKSQVVLARKPVPVKGSASGSETRSASRSAGGKLLTAHEPARGGRGPIGRSIVAALKDGSIELAGINLRWSLRRSGK